MREGGVNELRGVNRLSVYVGSERQNATICVAELRGDLRWLDRERIFNVAAEKAGVEWATPHTLRHAFASLIDADG